MSEHSIVNGDGGKASPSVTSRNRRAIFVGTLIAAAAVLCKYTSSHKPGVVVPLSDESCQFFRQDMDGDVLCDALDISKYTFNWGNADCSGILPSIIIRPKSDEDIARTVQRSASLGIPVSVRSGGHSYVCDSIKQGSAHIDLRSRKRKRLYQQGDAWYAEFETGNTFTDLFEIIDRKRFSVVHGACHAVGVGGFYLHGGLHLNSLTALHGFGNETVVNMTVVTASGKILSLNSNSEHQDLWQGMRRAGSNFGIATRLTVKAFEHPEPRMWLFWAQMPHSDVMRLFRIGMTDPRVQLNLYFVNPPFFQITSNRSQTFTFQFSLLDGPQDYWQNLKRSVTWFESQGFPLSWWTIAFNAVVPKPDDLTSLGYPKAWVSSSAMWRASSNCTAEAMAMLLNQQSGTIQRESFPSFGLIDCWLTFSRLPPDFIWYEYNCPSSASYTEHVRHVEAQFSSICEDFVKYRNTPNKHVSSQRYYPDHVELLEIKKKWDPKFLLGPETQSLRDFNTA